MTPDHVRGRLSSDAGATSSSIISLIVPSPMPTLSLAPSLTLSPVSTTSGNLIHRPFAGGLLSAGIRQFNYLTHSLRRECFRRDAIFLYRFPSYRHSCRHVHGP